MSAEPGDKYFTFLVCFHKGHTDVFLSGQPIGVIRDGKFSIHQIITPSGNLRDTTMRDLGNQVVVGGVPGSLDELTYKVMEVLKGLTQYSMTQTT